MFLFFFFKSKPRFSDFEGWGFQKPEEALRRLQKLWVLFDFTFWAWNDQVTASAAAAALA